MENQSKAEILIGRMAHPGWELDPYYETCFSLYFGNKIRKQMKALELKPDEYIENCGIVSDVFGRILAEEGISNYSITEGARTRSEGLTKVGCLNVPFEGVKQFRKILERTLKEIIAAA